MKCMESAGKLKELPYIAFVTAWIGADVLVYMFFAWVQTCSPYQYSWGWDGEKSILIATKMYDRYCYISVLLACLLFQQFTQAPNMIRNSSFHRGSDFDTAMDTAKIVVSEPQSQSCVVIGPLLGKGVGQARISSGAHSSGQIVPLDVRSTDPLRVRVAEDFHLFASDTFSRGIAPLVLRIRGVNLDELREVHKLSPETEHDCISVRRKSIGRNLKIMMAFRCVCELFGKCDGVGHTPVTQMPGQDQLGIPLYCGKDPAIADAFIGNALLRFSSRLHADVLPLLVALNVPNWNAVYALLGQSLTPLANQGQQVQDRSHVNASNPLGTSQGTAFNQMGENRKGFIFGQDHIAKKSLARLYESHLASQAAVTLLTLPILAEFLCERVAVLTVHLYPLLDNTRISLGLSSVNIFVLLCAVFRRFL